MKVVVIDPGHGGSQKVGGSSPNNAKGPNGLLEKDLTLDIATRVRDRLQSHATVMLTRTNDTNVGLVDRARVAKDNNADVFLSIHLNGFSDPSVDGTEVWIAKNPTGQSQQLAEAVLNQVFAVTNVRNRGVKQKPADSPDFVVLRPAHHNPNTSVALVEIAFLTNPAQATQLANTNYRDQIAEAISAAVQQHIAAPVPQPAAQGYGYNGYGQGYTRYGTPGRAASQSAYALREVGEVQVDTSHIRNISDLLSTYSSWISRQLSFQRGVEFPTMFPHSAICQLEIRNSSGRGTGTGFYIAPNRILTVGHNLNFNGAQANSITVHPGRHHNMSTFPSFTVTGSHNWQTHPNYHPSMSGLPYTNFADFDLGVIKVTTPPPDGYFAIEELRMSPMSGIIVCGYAARGSDIDRNQQNMDIDTIRQLDDESFTYALQVRRGTSGGPAFYIDGDRVIAVGIQSTTHDDHTNRGCRLTDAKVRWIQSV